MPVGDRGQPARQDAANRSDPAFLASRIFDAWPLAVNKPLRYRRWLDDTFWLPPALTAGKSVITVTLTPAAGSPAWTAARYTAHSVVAPFTDRTPPGQVSGLTATGDQYNTIHLSWQPATDNVGVDHYNVYASTSPDAAAGPATLIGQTTTTTFDHPVGLKQRWYYRVSAVDPAGNQGSPSAQATAASGDEIGFDTGTAGEQPWLWDADGSAIDGANRRFADGTHYFVYRFGLPAGTTSGAVTLSIDNEYLVQASSDGQNWTTVMTETNQIRDGSNKADRSIDITPYLGAGKTVYIRVADSFPQDGWGGRVSHVTVTFN